MKYSALSRIDLSLRAKRSNLVFSFALDRHATNVARDDAGGLHAHVMLLLLLFCALTLTACAIQRPLIRPAEIPAYEEKKRKKLQEREEFLREQQQRQQEMQSQ